MGPWNQCSWASSAACAVAVTPPEASPHDDAGVGMGRAAAAAAAAAAEDDDDDDMGAAVKGSEEENYMID